MNIICKTRKQLYMSKVACIVFWPRPLFIATWEECGNYYCFNGGTCVNETCQCAEGFGGEYCLYSEFPVYTKLCHDFIIHIEMVNLCDA